MSFRPAFWPTVFAVPAFLVLLGLGTWQVERLHWKEGLIAARSAALAAPPVPLPEDPAAARRLAFRRVTATGTFLHDKEFLLGASNAAGTTGYHVVTPLRLASGKIVLVDRGWIESRLKDPATRPEGEIAGSTEVAGILRDTPEKPSFFVPDNRCDRNYWFWVDIPAMAECGGLRDVMPVLIEAGPAPNPGGWPKGGQTRTELRNDHLQYAITWYSLAVALAVIYVLFHRSKAEETT